MGRAPLLGPFRRRGPAARIVVAALALLAATLGSAAAEELRPGAPFPVRMVKLGGPAGSVATRRHLEFCVAAGFNAVWVYGNLAGRWTAADAPAGPTLDPGFVELTRWCRERGLRIFVSVNPIAESGGRFVFSDRDGARRIRAFFRLLRRECGVRDFVLSFDDQPRAIEDVRDVATFGPDAAAAHLDLARRVLTHTGRGSTAWLCAAVYSDWHLEDPDYEPYAGTWLAGLHRLRSRIGIVWTGPDTLSESITAKDVETIRARLAGRRILLYDNYPVNDDWRREALGLVIGPLRNRDPRLRDLVTAYLACPMEELGGSRLPLLTIADFLRDPEHYDPEASWKSAMARLAGTDPAALDALRIQGLEWGGWIGTRNYQGEAVSPVDVAAQLDDPGIMASWNYTIRRYEDRILALGGLADHEFRDDLVEAMRRRFAVARALPIVRGMRGLGGGSKLPPEEAARSLRAERERLGTAPNALRALDRFLEAAGVLDAVVPGGVAPARAP